MYIPELAWFIGGVMLVGYVASWLLAGIVGLDPHRAGVLTAVTTAALLLALMLLS